MKSNALCSKSSDLNVNDIKKIFSHPVFDKITGHHDLAKLTHKINHPRWDWEFQFNGNNTDWGKVDRVSQRYEMIHPARSIGQRAQANLTWKS